MTIAAWLTIVALFISSTGSIVALLRDREENLPGHEARRKLKSVLFIVTFAGLLLGILTRRYPITKIRRRRLVIKKSEKQTRTRATTFSLWVVLREQRMRTAVSRGIAGRTYPRAFGVNRMADDIDIHVFSPSSRNAHASGRSRRRY